MRSGKSSSLLKKILVVSSLPAVLAASYFWYPESSQGGGPPLCMFKLLFGLPCLGCGLTRAFGSLTRLEFLAALQFHLLSPFLFLYALLWYAIEVRALFRGFAAPRWWRNAGHALLLAMAFLYTGRMVEFFSHPEGMISPLKHNITVRLVRWDWENTYEPWGKR